MLSELLGLILMTLIFGYFIWQVVSDAIDPLSKLPGPRKLPILGNGLMVIGMTPRQMFELIRTFNKKYGERIYIKILGRKILQTTSPKDVEVFLSHSRNITKNRSYSFLEPWLGTGLLLSTGAKWHKRRKILTPTFHFNILRNFAKVIEEKSRDMVEKLKKHEEVEIDLMPFISDFTLYTICETAMGTQLDVDQSAASKEYKKAIIDIGPMFLARISRFWLHFNFIFEATDLATRFNKCVKKIHSFADTIIIQRQKDRMALKIEEKDNETEAFGGKKRLAMLDLLLEAESKGEIDLEGIREEVNTFMFEGHDTTATALSFGLMLLADHPEVQDRIFEELERIFSVGDSKRTASLSDIAEMKYLEAVIKETLRLYPSVPFIARILTEDCVLHDGFVVKKGTEIGVHIYDLHRRADLFSDPEAFTPERFLTGEMKHPYAFVPFSAGPRNCIGQKFAMQEMKCALSEICRNFTLSPREKGFRPALVSDVVLRTPDPMYVTLKRR